MAPSSGASLAEAGNQTTPAAASAAARLLHETGRGPLRAAFIARALDALTILVRSIDAESVSEAAAAMTPFETLVKALQAPSAAAALLEPRVREDDSEALLRKALLRGLLDRQAILRAEGGTVPTEEAARILGISPQAVTKRRKAGKLIGLTLGRRGYVYPLWQFDRGGTIAGLQQVLAQLHEHDPWMQAIFMLNHDLYLDGARPLDELRHGNLDAVLRAARAYGEHGAA